MEHLHGYPFLGAQVAFSQAAEDAEVQFIEVQQARTQMEDARRQLEEAARTIAIQAQALPDTPEFEFEFDDFGGLYNLALAGRGGSALR